MDDVDALVAGLSHQDRDRILKNVLWDVFGDLDDAENMRLVPGRRPDRVDVEVLVDGLRQELWPEQFSAADEPDEDLSHAWRAFHDKTNKAGPGPA